MASLEEIRNTRLQKLELLKKEGMEPYPAQSHREFSLAEVIEKFDAFESAKKDITIAGRIMSLRAQGGLIFFHLFDGTAKFQGLIKQPASAEAASAGEEEISVKLWDLFSNAVDIGDFIEITGTVFVTKRGEKTLAVASWRMLAKSLLQLPEKWHGLQDIDERFRKRYLDILMSEEVRNRFITRSKIISTIRDYLNTHDYLEVETPVLQPLAGGASAEPFTTHHKALDIDLFLRIAPELYLKKLLIAGFPKVYELSRNFRNEGIDMTHNPEFTMLEFYEAYGNALTQRAFVENMLKTLVQSLAENSLITFEEDTIDFTQDFAVVTYSELLQKVGLPEGVHTSPSEVIATAQKKGIKIEKGDSKEKIFDNIYKKEVRPKLIQPTFIVDYPVDYLPLAKKSLKDPAIVDAFQLVIGGVEIVKAFSELNDPIDQRERFKQQDKNKAAGDSEAQQSDEEFVEAMEYGMPPAGGVGIGIDRLVMLLTNTRNVKEVIAFPTMKPKS